ncbi:sigma factor regulatory protein, FecR/PupR family [Bacteroides pyogenes F0041]|uniref:Sigma factor regulatory protein, FecR/PupR family n=2 Tax=Bacteroides pyogenes TaxID=310300 RepID=U2DS52_9BACE|nr:sigma factor regulatory protein, FecR/PupR family [Bacteroides pyogenes F0041]
MTQMHLDKELLYRFFSQRTTPDEEKKIRLWLEESDEHRRELFRERKLFDALILRGDAESVSRNRVRRHFPWRRIAVAASGIAAVFLLAVATAHYLLEQSMEKEEMMNTVAVPQGQRVSLTLADGTHVWLNAMTRMEYPQSFRASDKRMVRIDGEAYFEVSRNSKKPFVVCTDKGNVEVLGTKFYVDAYNRTNRFETSLVEGSVKVSTPTAELMLHPNHKAVMLADGRLVREKITDMDVYRWKDGLYCFKDIPFSEVLKQFEVYYDVRFVFSKHVKRNPVISGKFRLVDGVDYALRVLQRDIPFSFRRSEESNIIYIE